MVNIVNLTINSCYKICEVPPSEQVCGICLVPLISPTPTEHNTVVKTKVCNHYFHQNCIDAWFRSATPNLNVCPLDRLVLYGEARVPQTPVNLPGYAPFPGHNVDEHDAQHGPLNPDSPTGQTFGANGGLGIMFGAMTPEDEFLNPGLTDFFSEDFTQPSQGTTNDLNAESSQDTESQQNESPYLPIGFRTMPGHDEDPREMRRWGW